MGARHSKRSVDISGKDGKDNGEDDAQPLEGKLEKIEEGAQVAENVNGESSTGPVAVDEERVPSSDADTPTDVTLSSPNSPEEENASTPVGQAAENPELSLSQPTQKKEKLKKKWSFRTFSFTKKDKQKPGKDDAHAHGDADLVAEVVEEKALMVESLTGEIGDVTKVAKNVVAEAEEDIRATGDATMMAVKQQGASTKDQVEQITAKVAEKAEALVVKMEAMSNTDHIDLKDLKVASSEVTVVTPEVTVVAPEVTVVAPEVTVVALPEVDLASQKIKVAPPKVEVTQSHVKVLCKEIQAPAEVKEEVKVAVSKVQETDWKKTDIDLERNSDSPFIESLATELGELAPKMVVDPSTLEVVDQFVYTAALSHSRSIEDVIIDATTSESDVVAVVGDVLRLVDLFPPPLPINPPPINPPPINPPPINPPPLETFNIVNDMVMEVVDNAVTIAQGNEGAVIIAEGNEDAIIIAEGNEDAVIAEGNEASVTSYCFGPTHPSTSWQSSDSEAAADCSHVEEGSLLDLLPSSISVITEADEEKVLVVEDLSTSTISEEILVLDIDSMSAISGIGEDSTSQSEMNSVDQESTDEVDSADEKLPGKN